MSPSRPLRVCAEPGCATLVRAGRCAVHERKREKDPEQQRFYNSSRWQKIRALIRRRDPVCTMCEARPSKQVHHRDGDWRNNLESNLAGVCAPCHAKHSGKDHRAKRQG